MPSCHTLPLAIDRPFRVFLTSYYFSIFDDSGPNSRADYLGEVMRWLTATEIESESEQFPTQFALLQNYPNPFNGSTIICCSLERSSALDISIYNIAGQKIESLFAGYRDAGNHEIVWNGSAYPSGVYFAQLTTRYGRQIIRMVLLK